MNRTRRTLGIRVLAVLLLTVTSVTFLLTACKDSQTSQPQNPSGTTGGQGATGDPNSMTAQITQTYGDYDFNKYEFRILGMESGSWWYKSFMDESFNEIWYETDSAEPLQSSIYTRNRRTEDLLNISIEPVWTAGSEETAQRVRTAGLTSDTDYDICLASLYDTLVLAQEGRVVNYYDITTLDLSHSWWDQKLVESYTIFKNKLYVLAGAINVYDDMSVSIMLFNKDLAGALGLDNPYQMVRDNQWTLDSMVAMAKAACHDDGNGTSGQEDTWGIWYGTSSGGLFAGFDLDITELDEEGTPYLAVEREEHVNAALQLYEKVIVGEVFFDGYASEEDRNEAFADDRLLFYTIMTCYLNRFRDMQTDFGILPMPKLNAEQERYGHFVNFHFYSTYFVPVSNTDLDRTGTIMDVMGGYSVDTVYETTFGTLMGYDSKLLRDNDSKDMLDIVFNSKMFDYSVLGLGQIRDIYNMNDWGSFMYESAVDTYKRPANSNLKKIIANFEALD